MENVRDLLGTAVSELERILTSKTVVGEPITIADVTLVPLVSVGFGFGAGGGPRPGQTEEGAGGGTGGGGGIKPIAVVIIDKQGARLETIKGHSGTFVEKMADIVSAGIQKAGGTKAKTP